MKAVKSKLQASECGPEVVTAFEKGAAAAAKKLVANFKDLEFYTGESMNPEGMYVPPPGCRDALHRIHSRLMVSLGWHF